MTGQSLDMNMEGRAAVSPLQRLIMYTFCAWQHSMLGLLRFGSCCCVPPLYCCHVPPSISESYWLRICL